MRRTAREKLVEKDIKWGQVYTDKTQFLKEQYHDVVGPGSYFRFEGEASDGDSYYCIIGPAKVHKPRAKWFAGVRKLPATYSAGGKYFDSMDGAAKYAKETWGVPTPKDLKPYTSAQLFGISDKIYKWKEQREKENEENEDEEENKEENRDKIENKSSTNRIMLMKSFNLSKFRKEAMGSTHQENRDIYNWFDIDTDFESNAEWQNLLIINPSLGSILRDAERQNSRQTILVKQRYGLTESQVDQVLKTYVGYDIKYGGYVLTIGPYTAKGFPESWDKFGFFSERKAYQTEEAMLSSLARYTKKYADTYNVSLEPSDFTFKDMGESFVLDPSDPNYANFFSSSKRMVSRNNNINFSNSGMVKFMKQSWGPLYDLAVENFALSRNISNEEAEVLLLNETDFIKLIFKVIQQKYKEAEASGIAAIEGMVPPPESFGTFQKAGTLGQLKPTTIKDKQKTLLKKLKLNDQVLGLMSSGKEDPEEITTIINSSRTPSKQVTINTVQSLMQEYRDRSINENKEVSEIHSEFREDMSNVANQVDGFSDLKTAFDAAKAHLGHDVFTISANFHNVTEENIREIRLAYEEAKQRGEQWPQEENTRVEVEDVNAVEEELDMEVGRTTPDVAPESIPSDNEVEQEVSIPEPEDTPASLSVFPPHITNIYQNTLNSLMVISKDLSKDGKINAAEEINKIIRKYQKGTK